MPINYPQILDKIADNVVAELTKELLLQNHRASGNLIKSLETKIAPISNGYEIRGLMNRYGIYLDKGVKKNRIPYNPNRRSGAGKSLYIQALADWIKLKGLKMSPFAIAATHAAEGMPTNARKAATRNKGVGWLSLTLAEKQKSFAQGLRDEIGKGLKVELENVISRNNRKFTK